MRRTSWPAIVAMATGLSLGAGAIGVAALRSGSEAAAPAGETIEVELCDGETKTEIVLAQAKPTREEGQKVADALMSQWRSKNPDREWMAVERQKHMIVPPADNSELVGDPQGQIYGQITQQDVLTWERENLALVVRGSEVFHSPDELGSSIAVS